MKYTRVIIRLHSKGIKRKDRYALYNILYSFNNARHVTQKKTKNKVSIAIRIYYKVTNGDMIKTYKSHQQNLFI